MQTAKIDYLPHVKASTAAVLEDARQSIPDGSPMIVAWLDAKGVSWIQSAPNNQEVLWMAQRILHVLMTDADGSR